MRLETAIAGVTDTVIKELKGKAFTVRKRFATLPLLVLEVSSGVLSVLERLPQVADCRPDEPLRLILPIEKKSGTDNSAGGNPDLNRPFLDNTTGIIGADSAWGMGYTGSGWYVAVLDTGILNTHEFFSGKNIVEKCYSEGNNCPDGTSEDEGPGAAAHFPSTYEGFDHGTHVAGIATGNNGTLYGVAREADIIAVQVFSQFTASECDSETPCVMAYDSDTLKGLEYIYQLRSTYSIASVNMSLGADFSSNFCDDDIRKEAIDNLRAVGIATIITTGNDGYCGAISYPACISSSISVGASTDTDTEALFNNWHPILQRFFAPGVDIYSSTGASNSSYESWSGTSMAAPHVAGAWALLRQAKPAASADEIFSALSATGTLIETSCLEGGSVPRINVDLAISCDPAVLMIVALAPEASAILVPGKQALLNARVSDQCGQNIDDVTVETSFSNGDTPIALYDDGLHDDGNAADGIYGNWWTPANEQDPTAITYTASKSGYTPATDQVDVNVSFLHCRAEASDCAYEYITNVSFAGINNDSTNEGCYSDYTSGAKGTVTAGADENLSVEISADADEYLSAFIDWNQDLDFDDPGERYDLIAGTDQPGPFTTLISVPADALPGDTRLRVVLRWGSSPEPCGQFAYGEVEDYPVTIAPAEWSLDLVQSWNLISLPLSPADKTIASVLSTITGKYISVWSFSSGTWKLHDPANPGFSDLTEMEAGIGYWINMSEAATLTFSGSTPSDTIPISTGWNLVGYNSTIFNEIEESLTSIAGKYISVWAHVNSTWKLHDPANPGFSDLLTMDPAYGYWINAAEDCIWTLP